MREILPPTGLTLKTALSPTLSISNRSIRVSSANELSLTTQQFAQSRGWR